MKQKSIDESENRTKDIPIIMAIDKGCWASENDMHSGSKEFHGKISVHTYPYSGHDTELSLTWQLNLFGFHTKKQYADIRSRLEDPDQDGETFSTPNRFLDDSYRQLKESWNGKYAPISREEFQTLFEKSYINIMSQISEEMIATATEFDKADARRVKE
jgi:hypothetical protein